MTLSYRALILTVVEFLTVDVSIAKLLVVSPAATETLAGTLATSELVVSTKMGALPAGANAVKSDCGGRSGLAGHDRRAGS